MTPVIHRVAPYSAEWRQLKAMHVCATDMPCLLGHSKDKSIKRIIASKKGEPSKPFDNLLMRVGRYLEPAAYVALNEAGMPAEPADPKLFVFVSNTDYKIGSTVDGKMMVDQGFYIVEIKSTYLPKKWEKWKVAPSIKHWIQVQTQLLSCGRKRALLACLCHVLPMPLIVYEIHENHELHNIMKKTSLDFWELFDQGKKFKVNRSIEDEVLKLYKDSIQNAEIYKLYVDNSPLLGLSYKEGE